MSELVSELNRLAGTTGLEAAGAANALAGTTGLELVGALNAYAGTAGRELLGAIREISGGAETLAGFEGGGGTPTTYTIFGDVSDGYLDGPAGAADGAGGSAYTNIDAYCGQNGGASGTAYQAFLAFDTSSISDTATITAVTLSLWGVTDSSTTDFTIEVRSHDWGASLLTGDWLSRATIATKTLVASRSTAGFSTSGYNIFTSEAAFLAAINKTGFTRLVVNSSIWRAAGAGSDLVGFKTSDVAGTTNDPKLVVEALV